MSVISALILLKQVEDLTALLKEAGEALEPFADEPILPEFDDDLYKDTQIQVIHFRRAAEVARKIQEA